MNIRRGVLAVAAVVLAATWIIAAPLDVIIRAVQEGRRNDLGVSRFTARDVTDRPIAEQVQGVVRDDLLFTRLFNIVEPGWQYLPNPEVSKTWKERFGIDLALCGELVRSGTAYMLRAAMYDTETAEVVFEQTFASHDTRYLAHLVSDTVVMRFFGEYGIATTRIVFVNNQTGRKELYIMDYDGANLQRLTDDRSIAMYPRVSPDGSRILYTSYKKGNPDLFLMNIDGTGSRAISTVQGLNITANWSPDGQRILVTMTHAKHDPNMYLLDTDGGVVRRITSGRTIDVSGFFAPNGREIVFISNRTGIPQMYLTDLEGFSIRRLPTQGYTDSPVWSPAGDRIVFCMQTEGGRFDIYRYDIAANEYYRMTQSEGSSEQPYFSPDGRFVVFTSNRRGRYELYTMFLDGSGQRRIVDIPGNSMMPCWTPRRMVGAQVPGR
jgi:TolB protein